MFQRFTSLFLVFIPFLLMAQPETKAQSKVGMALRMIERGDSLLEANQYQQAIELFSKARTATDLLEIRAMAATGLGSAYRGAKDYAQAENSHLEALQLRRSAVSSTGILPAVQENLAVTLNNLGIVCRDMKATKRAKDYFTESLEIRRKLAEKDPKKYSSNVAATLNNYANLLSDNSDLVAAEKLYTEAYEIYQNYTGTKTPRMLAEKSATINNLAALYVSKKDYTKAQTYYEEAINITEELSEERPEIFEPNLMTMCTNVATLFSDLKEYNNAIPFFIKALYYCNKVLGRTPDVYLTDLQLLHNDIAVAYLNLGDLDGAKEHLKEAEDLCEYLTKIYPDRYPTGFMALYENIGYYHAARKDFTTSIDYYQKSLKLRKELLKTEKSEEVYFKLPMTYMSMGNVYVANQDFKSAEEMFTLALQACENAKNPESDNALFYTYKSLESMGNMYFSEKQNKKAETNWYQGYRILEDLVKKKPNVYAFDAAEFSYNLGKYNLGKWREHPNKTNYEQANGLFEQTIVYANKAKGPKSDKLKEFTKPFLLELNPPVEELKEEEKPAKEPKVKKEKEEKETKEEKPANEEKEEKNKKNKPEKSSKDK